MDSSAPNFAICGVSIPRGETRQIYLKVSESFLAGGIQIPVTVVRGAQEGPVAYVVAAVHGDEINGADIVRRLILRLNPLELSGTVIAIPVANIPGFLNQSRYLHYNRDLNRYFPGSRKGNNAERIAAKIFDEIVRHCDFGIDLHTASEGRVNLPHVRGNMKNAKVRALARSFGATILVDQDGVRGSLRREATDKGVPTILFEAGETGRFSRRVSLAGLSGVLNVLASNGMLADHVLKRPPFQVIVKTSEWLRAHKGGILDLTAQPGDLVYKGDTIGSVLNPFGVTVTEIKSPTTGIIIGTTTAPLCIPGTGIVHVAKLKRTLPLVERSIQKEKRRRRKTRWRRNLGSKKRSSKTASPS